MDTDSTPRRVYLIDREFQLREVNRGVIMFMGLIILQVALFIGVAYFMRIGKLDRVTGPTVFVGIAFAVPMLMCVLYSWITIRRSHRVAGAAFRLGRDIPNLVRDPSFRFSLRKDDYLQSLVVELNQVMERIESQQAQLITAIQLAEELTDELEPIQDKLSRSRKEVLEAHLKDLKQVLARAKTFEADGQAAQSGVSRDTPESLQPVA